MELVDVDEGDDEGKRREEPDRGDRDATFRPRALAGGDYLHGDRGPVRRSEERRGDERRLDLPCEVHGGLLGEHRELEAREEDEEARYIEQGPRPLGQRADARHWARFGDAIVSERGMAGGISTMPGATMEAQ